MALSDATRLADFATGVGTDGTLGVNNINATGIVTATGGFSGDLSGSTVNLGTGVTNYSGILSATQYYGDGSALTNVISGVELKSDGNSVGTAITQINFSGFGSVTAPVSGFSTVTVDRFLTIGTRTGSAVTFTIADSSFIVEARGGGDVTINL
jgi:hypothetical protein